MELRLTRCVLRPWRPGDEPSLVRHADNRNIWMNVRDRFPHPYTAAHAAEWVRRATTEEPLTQLAIEVGGEAVGGVGIELGTDVARRSAEIGYWLGEPFWGRGIATEAVQAFTAWAFATYDLVRIQAEVFAWNVASARVLEKAGYRFEGRRRRAVYKAGRLVDALGYAVVRE